jgi:hypothetical protein
LDALLDRMWRDYTELNPQARQIYELFVEQGEQVVNDHIALRTFDLPAVSIEVLAKPFVRSGYQPKGEYEFPIKKLFARHYEHPEADRPKVFISQLDVAALPPDGQAIIERLVAAVDPAATQRLDFCCSGRPWNLSFDEYRRLAGVSEYAGWLAAIGYRPNHFTVLVNALERFPSLESVNQLLEGRGFLLNDSGGKIKGSPTALLEQSSVRAGEIDVDFSDGAHRVPGCYYEFARRYPQPDGSLYPGFIAASADRIFESTDRAAPAIS